MPLLTMHLESLSLKGNTQISLLLPQIPHGEDPKTYYTGAQKYKVLWLLHGTFGDHSDWIRYTGIELYAKERNLMVVMPSALNSNYSNWENTMLGYNMYDFLTEELMPMVHHWFPASRRREDNFIAGLSMGGRGAVKYAVNRPELFAGAAVLSAVPVDFSQMRPGHPNPFLDPENPRTALSIQNAGGLEKYIHSQENVWDRIDEKTPLHVLPRLFFACGQEDSLLYKQYLLFQKHCSEIGLDAEWFSLPGYAHEWRFWDIAIEKALDFFKIQPVRKY